MNAPEPPPIQLRVHVAHHERRLRAAREWALWHLGDPAYANAILGAYEEPATTMDNLRGEGAFE